MSNTANENVLMPSPEQCSELIFLKLYSNTINNAVKVDLPAIEQVLANCSSNPLIIEEIVFLHLISASAKYLSAKTAPFITAEAHHEQ